MANGPLDGRAADLPAKQWLRTENGTPIDTACRAHDPTAGELSKQRRAIDPLRTPALYSSLFYGDASEPGAISDVDGAMLRRYRRFDDADSGLSGVVLLDDATGHALIVFKGMDRPFADGQILGGVITDLGGVLAATLGTGNAQIQRGEDVYTEALCDDAVRSIEMVGYSMGSQIANYLAIKYGAYGVVFGDMGVDLDLLGPRSDTELDADRARARDHIISLSLSGDMLVKLFGGGQVVGSVVDLPGGLVGVFHQPELYAHAANSAIEARESERASAQGAQDGMVTSMEPSTLGDDDFDVPGDDVFSTLTPP